MTKGINYWAFPAREDGSAVGLAEAFKAAKELGYDCFEVTVEAKGELSLETSEREAGLVRKAADANGLRLLTVASGLAWGESPTDPDPGVRERAVETNLKLIEICSWLGAKTLLYLPGMVSAVFVPGFGPQPYPEVDRRAREALARVLPTAERLRVDIAVENVWNRYLLSALEMRGFIDSFGSERVGSYFDTGNCLLFGHPEDWIRVLGERIKAVHLKDFRVSVGTLDGFVDLLSGDVGFPGVMAELDRLGYRGPFTAEIVPGRLGAAEKAIAAMRIIERSTRP